MFLERARNFCKVSYWAVLDDMDLIEQRMKAMKTVGGRHSHVNADPFAQHFVKCSMEEGLTERQANTTIAILLGQPSPAVKREQSSSNIAGRGLAVLVEEDIADNEEDTADGSNGF